MTLASGVVAGSNGEVGSARLPPWHAPPPGSTWAVPPSSSLPSGRPKHLILPLALVALDQPPSHTVHAWMVFVRNFMSVL